MAGTPLTPADQAALLWPIQAKGPVTRISPLGDPTIETLYHPSMEQGRFLESSIADANFVLLKAKEDLTQKILIYNHMNQLAVDGQSLIPKYTADSQSILATSAVLQSEVTALVSAIRQNIATITAIEASMVKMIQANLNALANLLNNICNWGIPSLPSIPNSLPDTIWNWNGFQFSPLATFATGNPLTDPPLSNTTFNFNFSLSQCQQGQTAPLSALLTTPATVATYDGVTFGTQSYTPPLMGVAAAGQSLTDPAYIAQMQAQTTPPVYGPTFNPNTSMLGSVPDPHTIISDYQMPAVTYTSNIVAIVPSLRGNVVEPTDSDYSNPNYAVRNLQLRKDLVHFITLANIVASNYDPWVVSAWLIYLNVCRAGRGGVWLPNFEAAYNQYIQPSVSTLSITPVPWNDVLSETNYEWMSTWNDTVAYQTNDVVVFNGVNYVALVDNTAAEPDVSPTDWGTPLANVVYSDAPVVALITTLQGMTQNQLFYTLWQLSYVEAALLGYTRTGTWDTNQDANYLAGPTGSDLDYTPTTITSAQSSLILGEGTATFPVPITFPSAMKKSLDQVIALATISIQNDYNYLSPRLGNRYTYNQFAVATQVDRFSQFWRDFATNLTNFLAQDPYLVQFTITYPLILDGVLDPLANATNVAAYASLLQDASTRSRSWTPGTPLLTIPIAPIVSYQNSSTPTGSTNGWISPTELDPVAFLSRPDIQALPIPVQTAMLRTNISYAGLNLLKSQIQAAVATNIANANALLVGTQQIGFQVVVNADAITATSITADVLTVVVNNTYQPGNNVLLTGTAEPFLNYPVGPVFTVLAASATQFTVAFTNPNYSNPADTGTTSLVTYVPFGTSTPVGFDVIAFDYTGNVDATPFPYTTFTIQTAGTYSGTGSVNFIMPAAGTATVTVIQNSIAIATASVTGSGTLAVPFSFTGTFNIGDVVQVLASTNFVSPYIASATGGSFNMTLVQVVPSPGGSSVTQGNTGTFTADSTLAFLTAVQVDADGNVTAIDPTVPVITNVSITGNVLTITAVNHLKPAGNDLVTFSGMGTATFLNGQVVTTTAATGTTFTAPFTHANYSAADTGSVLYAIDASGAVLAPNPDGVTLTTATAGNPVTVTTYYGAEYYVEGAPVFTPGALLYVGPGGVLTQDYTTLITQVGWILCVGRVTAFNAATNTVTFIYEPHVPTRFSSMI